MTETRLREIADAADMIVSGYAFTCCDDDGIRVLNLNNPTAAAVFSKSLEPLEMSMDDIEVAIVRDILERNYSLLVA